MVAKAEMMAPDAVMSVNEAIAKRRSVRSYQPGHVDESGLRSLLEAAVWAPSARHEESWAFAVVQDVKLLKRISDRAKELLAEVNHRDHWPLSQPGIERFSDPGFNIFYNAGTLIVICGTQSGPYVAADCWMAAENLMLAACAADLGTCVIGLAVAALNDPQVKAEMGIPAAMTAIVPIIVGKPYGTTRSSARKPPLILSWR